ncbi:uncharacterized protein LOC126896695 [Daktulosphaira vitifoliae]|uniref:uncharacterized protein LOC126896695 n=1 Tax=Daktulosphaira vitifoliae TaxID=58002 RepID=UPI0021AAC5A5|nr:uncharacterized protein LOC126896695 [Daktulosphaira vitifoliae]
MDNYYEVLGLKNTCSNYEVLTAFKKIILKYDIIKLNNEVSSQMKYAFEAFDVLSDPQWRELYDQYGENIKSGVISDITNNIIRYAYHGDIIMTYKSVFGSQNPFTHVVSMLFSINNPISHSENLETIKNQTKQFPLRLTLEEVYFGTLKKVCIELNDRKQKLIDVQIPRGIPANSKIVKDIGNGSIITFIIEDLPHKVYSRNGMDLIRTIDVSIKDVLCGKQFILKTLDHKMLRVNINQLIFPSFEKIVHGQGMPGYHAKDKEKGNIILKFRLNTPQYLSSKMIKMLLENISNVGLS